MALCLNWSATQKLSDGTRLTSFVQIWSEYAIKTQDASKNSDPDAMQPESVQPMRFVTCNTSPSSLAFFLSSGCAERAFCRWGVPRGFREAGDTMRYFCPEVRSRKAFLHVFVMGILTTCAKMPQPELRVQQ